MADRSALDRNRGQAQARVLDQFQRKGEIRNWRHIERYQADVIVSQYLRHFVKRVEPVRELHDVLYLVPPNQILESAAEVSFADDPDVNLVLVADFTNRLHERL